MPYVMETDFGPTIAVPISENEGQLIPLAAVASWGELLGLTDEEALSAILDEWEPDEAGRDDNGWTGLYDVIGDQMQTGVSVRMAMQQPVGPGLDNVAPELLTLMGRHGPEMIVLQAEAMTENEQRTRTAKLTPTKVEPGLLNLLAEHTATVSEARTNFRGSLAPTVADDTGGS